MFEKLKHNRPMILPQRTSFNFKEVEVGNEPCWLITPKDGGVEWDETNYLYRSVIIEKKSERIVSMGFPKFFNYGEMPELHSWNNDWGVRGSFKYDGSLIICSILPNGDFICRTRGTVDVSQLPSGNEIKNLVNVHNVESCLRDYIQMVGHSVSFLFEYISPNHVIVLREFQEPTLVFLASVRHLDGYIVNSNNLLDESCNMGLTVPDIYTWKAISNCIEDVKSWKGKEGIVIYSPDGQILKKIKSDHYRKLHSLMFGMKNFSNVLDVFMNNPTTKYSEFFSYIENTIDHEVALNCVDHIRDLTIAYSKFCEKLDKLKNFISTFPREYSRKEFSQDINFNYKDWRVSVAFSILDNKDIPDRIVRKAIQYEHENKTNRSNESYMWTLPHT
jgi:hypothetical protein